MTEIGSRYRGSVAARLAADESIGEARRPHCRERLGHRPALQWPNENKGQICPPAIDGLSLDGQTRSLKAGDKPDRVGCHAETGYLNMRAARGIRPRDR